jgi:hypothetical protein
MAKIQTQSIVITLNKLVKDSDDDTAAIASEELVASLAAVAEELAGNGVVVEVQIA